MWYVVNVRYERREGKGIVMVEKREVPKISTRASQLTSTRFDQDKDIIKLISIVIRTNLHKATVVTI